MIFKGGEVKKLLVIIVLFGGILFQPIHSVLADMAPPPQPPGSLPEPGKTTTMVQMVSESINISISGVGQLYYENANQTAVNAQVRALFSMQNQGSRSERMQARFPLSNPSSQAYGMTNPPEIQNLRIWVDQAARQLVISEDPISTEKDSPIIRWANFEINFPAGKPVLVDMSFELQSTGWLPQAEFDYLLETGAGWYGPIGKGEINLILPYAAASGENINLKESSSGGKINASMITWTFSNLEPTANDNWHTLIIDPETWQSILDIRKSLEKNPEEADLLKELKIKYGDIIFGKGLWNINSGNESLAVQYRDVVQKLISLEPDDANLKSEYAGILYAMHQNPDRFTINPPSLNEVYSALNQAYILNPKNWEISEMYKDLTRQGIQLPELGVKTTPTTITKPAQTPTSSPSLFEPFTVLFKDEEQLLFYGMVGIALLIIGFVVGSNIQKKKKG
jgi:hypothetical protein